jgi:hypothetical protein
MSARGSVGGVFGGALVALSFCTLLGLPPPAGARAVRVGPLQRITGASALPARCSAPGSRYRGAEVEPSLAVDPRDPRRLVVAWIDESSNVTASSSDSGRRWRSDLVPGISRCTGGAFEAASDPWLSIGRDGTTYLASVSESGASARRSS